jgi:hypothetical protein
VEHQLKSKRAVQSRRTDAFIGRLRALRSWQSARLAATYDDLHRDPRYAHAVEFFLTDLYGPNDFSQRDSELTRAWDHLKLALPRGALELLGRAVELDVLSSELDEETASRLAPGPLTAASYADAYRRVGKPDARQRQIDLTVEIGVRLSQMVASRWIGIALRAARTPARAAGFGTLQEFLERGAESFRRMGDARAFLEAIRERESRLMRELFRGAACAGGGEPG